MSQFFKPFVLVLCLTFGQILGETRPFMGPKSNQIILFVEHTHISFISFEVCTENVTLRTGSCAEKIKQDKCHKFLLFLAKMP